MNNKSVQYMKKDIKDALMTLHEMGNNAEDCILMIQTAFIYNTSLPLKDCKEKIIDIRKGESQFTNNITEIISDTPDLKPYVSIPGHLFRIGENVEKLAELIDKKNRDTILFSDKAIMETTFLLQRMTEILQATAAMILARNKFLSMYVHESQAGVERRAAEYATLHEERLIQGVCLPVASSLYINMLDAIKSIAWHAKEITTKLG